MCWLRRLHCSGCLCSVGCYCGSVLSVLAFVLPVSSLLPIRYSVVNDVGGARVGIDQMVVRIVCGM